ncbi:MAG: tetratricopeptide repeat-containing protein [Chitinophagaceae bacterium]
MPNNKKRCFVVMGFGTKTDFATGRKLDLNKTYRLLIKPVVEERGIICIRADEMRHSGTIDKPMYQELLKADIVIADLSTANVNAFYELGIRHALCPRTTIVISEDKLSYPFDLNHIKITNYTHLGDAIDYEEVERFRDVLGATIDAVLTDEQTDSPVYTFLDQLVPPSIREQAAKAAEDLGEAIEKAKEECIPEITQPKAKDLNQTLSILTQQGERALRKKDFTSAKALFNSALLVGRGDKASNIVSNNPYIIHRLVLSTYKAKEPDAVAALQEALVLLGQLDLNHTNDPETVALAGAIEKLFYENGQGDEHLDNAILYFERGYYLLNNRYNGINLAFLLNLRVESSIFDTREDKIADMIWANRTRRRVLELCSSDWQELNNRKDRVARKAIMAEDDEMSFDQITTENEGKFWILANKAEAYFGLGEMEDYVRAHEQAVAIEHDPWMIESLDQQIAKLAKILQKHGYLIQSNIEMAEFK